jgi:hypothetical protein
MVFNTKAKLIMIEERKHGKQNNRHDSRKYENKQNNFCGDLHS